MNNNCPNCGKGYNLRPDHVGRRINCKNCGAALVVEPSGLQLDPASPTATAPPDVPGMAPPPPGPGMDFDDDLGGGRPAPPRRRAMGRGFDPNQLMGSLPSWLDLSLFFFGIGLIFVLTFTLFTVIDKYKVASYEVDLRSGDSRIDRKVKELRELKDFKAQDEKDVRNKWTKDRKELEDKVLDSETAVTKWKYWYSWGILFGFIVLALASLGFLRSDSRVRRVVGAIVVVAQALLMFIMFAVLSMR